ncbi:helix-turn-helix domain-containing protein [Brevundimonas sp.]|uniref:helix-turn-helix domain-containing protein n=1 Tax=Brevundimonas sp. TaxID=1871086 RepID=UPI0035B46338
MQWSLRDLAAHTGLSLTTVHQAETGKRDPWDASAQAIIAAFEANGVELLGDGAPGARIHPAPLP